MADLRGRSPRSSRARSHHGSWPTACRLLTPVDDRLALSDPRVTRIESGDRAIDPLYPSWLWMGSTFFDFERDSAWRVLREPRYSRLVVALESIGRTALPDAVPS